MTNAEQLAKWVAGESIHNSEQGECCPDFSCCQPLLKATDEERNAFNHGDQSVRNGMLGMFLGRAIAAYQSETCSGKSVYISK